MGQNEWMDGWVGRWIGGWMDRWLDGMEGESMMDSR